MLRVDVKRVDAPPGPRRMRPLRTQRATTHHRCIRVGPANHSLSCHVNQLSSLLSVIVNLNLRCVMGTNLVQFFKTFWWKPEFLFSSEQPQFKWFFAGSLFRIHWRLVTRAELIALALHRPSMYGHRPQKSPWLHKHLTSASTPSRWSQRNSLCHLPWHDQ
jgi:hypothetical protein